MTEQPVDPGLEAARFAAEHGVHVSSVMTEQEFLGNIPKSTREKWDSMVLPRRQAYLPNGHRLPLPEFRPAKVDLTVYAGEGELGDLAAGRTDLLLEAEVHANHAVKSLENGTEGLDAGIAWLQSALAFALNARHGRDLAGGAI